MALLGRALERTQRSTSPPQRLRQALVVIGVAIVIAALLQLLQRSEATDTSFAIQQMEEEKVELRAQVTQLEAEIAGLSSLSRIEREARDRLKLAPPVAQHSLRVNVPWPATDQQWLPTRFAPEEKPAMDEHGSSWWRDLVGLLPFR